MKIKKLPLFIFIILCINAFGQKHSKSSQGITNLSLEQLIKKKDNSYLITNENISSKSGLKHLYLKQAINGIEVLGTESSLHLTTEGKSIQTHNNFIESIDSWVSSSSASLTAAQAIASIAQKKRYPLSSLSIVESFSRINRKTLFSNGNISRKNIPAKLVYYSNGTDIRLAWDISIYETTSPNWYNYIVDAATGAILKTYNWTLSCNILGDHDNHNHGNEEIKFIGPLNQTKTSTQENDLMVGSYFVYPMPIESPNYGGPSVVVDPDNAIASPFGWHDTDGVNGAEFTITRGNNTHTYEDGDNPGFSPDGGAALNFNFPINETYSNGDQSESGIITNLFYWTNIIHDVVYQYGFDSASGNFQENTYGQGGIGNDAVNAEAQDGSGTCNANFGTPPDGNEPTMQMYVCGNRDGDLDNGVIIHEYGHGISNRLTGGAANSNCLSNQEQMGEGWSDYYALMLTIEPGDMSADSRPIGTWLTGVGPNGASIRTYSYSTDFNINPHTYNDIMTESVPHGVGSVWAAMLWEMTWELIAVEGFDPDIYNGNGGNNTALALVTEALKLQPCSPGFIDGRDAILAADQALYGGSHVCEIWDAFARRGLGYSATQGSTNSRSDGTEAFDLPPNFSSFDTIDEICLADGIQNNLGGGMPEGGTYSGLAVTDNGDGITYTFDPSITGAGNATISYAVADVCTGNNITVNDTILVTDEPPVIICKGSGVLEMEGSADDSPNLNIEDLNTVSTTIDITEDVNITDLNIALDISHTYVEDMIITLISPAGTPVIIFNGGNDGCPGNNFNIILDDESINALNCNNGTPAFPEPNYMPSNPLTAFDNESTLGTWTLTIQDTFNQDPGILNYWRLDYNYEVNSLPLDVFLDVSGNATINADQLLESAFVECGGFTVTAGNPLASTVSFTTADIGLNNVNVQVTSDTGQIATCVAVANVIENTDGGQSITCPEDTTIACGDDSSPVNTGMATSISSCDPNPVITFSDEIEQTCGDTQIITRTWFSEDNCGNDIVSCIQTITIEDNSNPVVDCPEDIQVNTDPGQCTAIVNFDIVANDTCGSVSINLMSGLASGSEFPIGDTLNNFEIVDDCGNVTNCSFTVTVENTTIPVIECQNITVQLDEMGIATITPEDINSSSESVCTAASVSLDIDTFNCDNIGENNVVLTITDSEGNSDSCTAIVTVEDALAPEAVCTEIEVTLDENGMATINAEMLDDGSFDNCEIATFNADITTFNCDNIGENTVVLTVTDVAGNSSSCETVVTVVDNTTPTPICQNITVELDNDGLATIDASAIDDGSFDTCGNVTLEVSAVNFNCDTIGTNEITLIVTDESGNSAECIAEVTVLDNISPTAVCQNITFEVNEDGDDIVITPDMIDNGSTDNCLISSYEIDVDTFNCGNVGDNEVVLTVTDSSGNSASCIAIVTINPPSGPPVAACQNVTVVLDENGMGTLLPQNISANNAFNICGYELSVDLDTFTCEDAGNIIPVTLTVTNAQGDSDSCAANVFVVDNLDPIISCPEDTLVLAELAPFELPDFVANGTVEIDDNCIDQLVITQEPEAGTLVEEGETEITITVTDPSGNTAGCVFDIFVDPSLGINTSEILNTLSLYPNPATNFVVIQNPQGLLLKSAQLFDFSGRLIKTFNLENTNIELTFDISEIASASYFLIVEGEANSIPFQVIKE